MENSFIDYFQDDTEIYQGMKVIDQQWGGTTPLDLIVQLEKSETDTSQQEAENTDVEELEDEEEFDSFEEEFEESAGEAQYWFTAEKMEQFE